MKIPQHLEIAAATAAPRLAELIRSQLYVTMQRARGRELSRYIKELAVAERLERTDFESLHNRRLESILRYARTHVPLYQTGRWSEVSPDGKTRIADWPVLERPALQAYYNELKAEPRPSSVDRLRTSGSTGEPVRVMVDRSAAVRGWAHRYRALQWHGIPIAARTLRVTHDKRPLRDFLLGQLCVWPLKSADTIEASIKYLKRKRPTMVAGPPSALFYLARRLRDFGITKPLAPFARAGGEQLFPFQRQQIESTLGARAIDSYGTTETGAVAGECPAGNLHIYVDHLHLEICDGDRPVERGEFGDIVITTLRNRAMPLVRYRVGDKGRILTSTCRCGLPHPILADLQARSGDILLSCDGQPRHASTLVEKLSYVFDNADCADVREVEFRQIDHSHLEAIVETSASLLTSDIEDNRRQSIDRILKSIVCDALGTTCNVDVKFVGTAPRSSGKFRYYRAMSDSGSL